MRGLYYKLTHATYEGGSSANVTLAVGEPLAWTEYPVNIQ